MKLNRLAVIEAIDEIEANRAQRHAEKQQPRLDVWNEAVRQYREEDQPQLLAQLRGLVEKVRKGGLLTAQDLTETLATGRSGAGFYFHPPIDPTVANRYTTLTEKPTVEPYEPDRELAALRKILTQMTEDDTVTTSVLREMGFSPAIFVKKQVTI